MTLSFLPKLAVALLVGSTLGLIAPWPSAYLAVLFGILLLIAFFAYFKSLWTDALWIFVLLSMVAGGTAIQKLSTEQEQARWARLYGPVEQLLVRVKSDPYLEPRVLVDLIEPPYAGLQSSVAVDRLSELPSFGQTIRVDGIAHGRTIVPNTWEPAEGWVRGLGWSETIQSFAWKIRDRIDRDILKSTPAPAFLAFTRAELFGKRSDMDPRTLRLLQENGLTHIIAVSGSHTSLLAAVLFFLLVPALGKHAATWSTLAAVGLFCVMVGLQPSVVRAALCTALTLTGALLDRPVRLLNALAGAFILELLIFPEHFQNAGFQLSYVAVLAIALSADLVRDWIRSEPENLQKSRAARTADRTLYALLMVLLIQVFTAPLSAFYFYRWSLMSVLSNLIFLPVFTVLICLSAIGAAAALIWTAPAAWIFWIGDAILGAAMWCLDRLSHGLAVSSNFGELPLWMLALTTGGWIVFLVAAPRKPQIWLASSAVFLLLFAFIPWARHIGEPQYVTAGGDRMPFAAVGQGRRLEYVYISNSGGQQQNPERATRPFTEEFLRKGVQRIDHLDAPDNIRRALSDNFSIGDGPPPQIIRRQWNGRGFYLERSGLELLYWIPMESEWPVDLPAVHQTAASRWSILDLSASGGRTDKFRPDRNDWANPPHHVYITGAIEPDSLKSIFDRFEKIGVSSAFAYRVDGRLRIFQDPSDGWRFVTDFMLSEDGS